MAKTSRIRNLRRPVLTIFGISLALALAFAGYRYLYPPTPTPIFQIEPTPLTFGDTTLSGTLQKDSPVGVEGTFILVLSDSRPILLDIEGVDELLGTTVAVSGNLVPATDTSPMTMAVSSLTTE